MEHVTPQQYRLTQDKINRSIASIVLKLLTSSFKGIVTRKVTTRSIVNKIHGDVVLHREASHTLAYKYYMSQRQQQIPHAKSIVPNLGPQPYAVEALQASFDHLLGKAIEENRVTTGTLSNQTADVVRHVEGAGRQGIIHLSAIDDKDVRWGRYDPFPPTCAFCTTLISRGFVYYSDEESSAGFKAHLHDTCVPVVSFDGKRDPVISEQMKQAKIEYERYKSVKALRAKTAQPTLDKSELQQRLKIAVAALDKMPDKAKVFQQQYIDKLQSKLNTLDG